MPITQELNTIKILRDAGLTAKAAEAVAERLEAAAAASRDSSVDTFKSEMREFRAELREEFAKVDVRFAEMDARFQKALLDMQGRLFTAILGTGGFVVAAIGLLIAFGPRLAALVR